MWSSAVGAVSVLRGSCDRHLRGPPKLKLVHTRAARSLSVDLRFADVRGLNRERTAYRYEAIVGAGEC
jgi:hypothetical protein